MGWVTVGRALWAEVPRAAARWLRHRRLMPEVLRPCVRGRPFLSPDVALAGLTARSADPSRPAGPGAIHRLVRSNGSRQPPEGYPCLR